MGADGEAVRAERTIWWGQRRAPSRDGSEEEASESARAEDNETPLIDDGRPCLFTFVRDPLTRFVSAYSEFEYRQSPTFLRGDTVRVTGWMRSMFRHTRTTSLRMGCWARRTRKEYGVGEGGTQTPHKDSEEVEEEGAPPVT